MTNRYEVKGFRRINGHDGQGYEAKLYHNGKKIAVAFDDGFGGDAEIRWEVAKDTHVPAIVAILQNTEGWWSDFLKADEPCAEYQVAWFIEAQGN
tara:strand:+ start:213 stop:497 length:285 start_codon:yes stop_codon:yes gene_type:complete